MKLKQLLDHKQALVQSISMINGNNKPSVKTTEELESFRYETELI